MGHSSKYFDQLKKADGAVRGVKFDLVVARDFYDGPESGVAFYCTGEALTFSVVGESEPPMFRAFVFTLLNGNWAQLVKEVMDTSPRPTGSWMVFDSETDPAIAELMTSVSQSTEQCYYFGIGTGYFDELDLKVVSKGELDDLKTSGPLDRFDVVDRYIQHAGLISPPDEMSAAIPIRPSRHHGAGIFADGRNVPWRGDGFRKGSTHPIDYSVVIASQRVGAKRRPMTGSAKQSIFAAQRKNGLLRRCAPRNDESIVSTPTSSPRCPPASCRATRSRRGPCGWRRSRNRTRFRSSCSLLR
jgi:hypothetical protein